jgi:[acyl-carrier-protein] S-malonyltransferase
MAAILRLDRAAVEKTCLDASKNGIVSPAKYNSPGQIVIAGEKNAVEKSMELVKAAGDGALRGYDQRSSHPDREQR